MNDASRMPSDADPFDHLMGAAQQAGSEEELIHAFRGLWAAFLGLETWIFLTTGGRDLSQASPFIGLIEDQPWALVFTDPQKAAAFAGADPRFRTPEGHLLFIELPKLEALGWVMGLQREGVVGLRINQGKYGWFTPLAHLPAIVLDIEGGADLPR
ncbi:MAG TPA: hypothetical protein VJ505_10285 [Holophagaceae bacterium]|nr:hypothetical protein [Holophagaceae bacterium]